MRYANRVSEQDLREFFDKFVYMGRDKIIGFEVVPHEDDFEVLVDAEVYLDEDDEPHVLLDTYAVSDYDIESFDWGGDLSKVVKQWRRKMLNLFGIGYATDYLFLEFAED